MRDGEQPLDQRQPPVQFRNVGVRVVKADRLLILGCRISVVHRGQVRANPVAEPLQLKISVEPPARILLPEHDHEQGAKNIRKNVAARLSARSG
jgi:hypothetical protein